MKRILELTLKLTLALILNLILKFNFKINSEISSEMNFKEVLKWILLKNTPVIHHQKYHGKHFQTTATRHCVHMCMLFSTAAPNLSASIPSAYRAARLFSAAIAVVIAKEIVDNPAGYSRLFNFFLYKSTICAEKHKLNLFISAESTSCAC